MKKISLILLSLLMAFSMCLLSCKNENDVKNQPSDKQQTNVGESPNNSNETTKIEITDSPATDFKYAEEDGFCVIKQYIGDDDIVRIPSKIEGKQVTEIFAAAFVGKECTEVYLPEGIESIGIGAFEQCAKLMSVGLPNTLKEIGPYAFQNCTSLKSVALPEGITVVSPGAFQDCATLESITFPDTLTEIGNSAFSGCSALKNVTLPSSLEKVGMNAFFSCKSLTSITVPKKVNTMSSAFLQSGIETLILEDGIENIQDYAFGATQIKEVVVPSSVKVIGREAFSNCKNLEKITLNEGIISVGEGFIAETAITEIIIPNSLTNSYHGIQRTAFLNASQLKKVYFQGSAPIDFVNDSASFHPDVDQYPEFTVFYHENSVGFTSSEWNGFKTEIW